MRFKLETNGAIKTYQRQQLDRCGTQAEANSEFREILLQDATSETLLAVAGTLETAPDTSNMNKKFAKAIRQFLRSEGIYIFQLLTEYIIYYGLQNSEILVIFHCMFFVFMYHVKEPQLFDWSLLEKTLTVTPPPILKVLNISSNVMRIITNSSLPVVIFELYL